MNNQPLPVGDVATQIAEVLQSSDVLFLARDEERAERIAHATAAAAPESIVIYCPSSDALPGEPVSANAANIGRRVAALHRARMVLKQRKRLKLAMIATGEAAVRVYATPDCFDASPPILRPGDMLDPATFEQELAALGYQADERVDEPGEMAVRGGVIDIFPADASTPVRLEIEEGRILSLRGYDPVTQRGGEEIEAIEVGRASEPEAGGTASLFDHLPGANIMAEADAPIRGDRFLQLIADTAKKRGTQPPDRSRSLLARREIALVRPRGEPPPRFAEHRNPARAAIGAIRQAVKEKLRVLLVGSPRDLRFLTPRLARTLGNFAEIDGWMAATEAPPGALLRLSMIVEQGWAAPGIVAIAAADILGSRAERHGRGPLTVPLLEGLASELRVGDIVVHEEFGIGRLCGLETLSAEAAPHDAIVLEYARGSKRLVPVLEAEKIWRYGGQTDGIALDRLDGSSWNERRGEIERTIAQSAKAIARVAEERERQTAPVFEPDLSAYERFVAGFPYSETIDQARAIEAVRRDLASGRPMDRLVIGDVGYGKTEVALRAAALVALAGGQVALAAPTTVLVRQHLANFESRFASLGLRVASLSRFSTPAEKKDVRRGLADGSINIVVGTGAIAGKQVVYKNLGLVIIDEEQRFGAKEKAMLKALAGGHALTMSATPIPRTLQMALVGIQDISLITTPPARRQPIRTTVLEFDPPILRTALMREKLRAGQSFVVVPRIEDMEPTAERLRVLVPELSVRQAHGKMPAADIDAEMVAFADGDGDILLATNIIEAGLDVPRANTMLVFRSDRFGLAQLHQLRGRVGRGARRAQVILFTETGAAIAPATLKRLSTLEALDRLGAGFEISARDLDLRGAGDLLGEEQAGHIRLVGAAFYQHLLALALKRARGGSVEHLAAELNAEAAYQIPEDWVPSEDVRIGLYCRMARLQSNLDLDRFEEELEDRFGALPDAVEQLLLLGRIRIAARSAKIARIDAGPEAIAFTPRTKIEAEIADLGLERKGDRLVLGEAISDRGARLQRVWAVLDAISDARQTG